MTTFGHLVRLLDDTGIAQHATYAVVARDHGYCVDDNARALILSRSLLRMGLEPALASTMQARSAAFLQHAWNPATSRFRNFMGYDRQWLDEAGSEDSHGRAIWALGVVAQEDTDPDGRRWAMELLERAVPALPRFTSPRALAFGLIGLAACHAAPDGPRFRDVAAALTDRLCRHFADNCGRGWTWFEASLSYDNARLCQAVLMTGEQAGRADWCETAMTTLGWLTRAQTAEQGYFRPIGSDGFWSRGGARAKFDQQPIEATASIAACLHAWRHTGARSWLMEARRAHAWFTGANDLNETLVTASGGCRDGLHPGRVNANQGAESTLAWLQGDLDMREAEAAVEPSERRIVPFLRHSRL